MKRKSKTRQPIVFFHTFANGVKGRFTFSIKHHYSPITREIMPQKAFSRHLTHDELTSMFPEYREWAHVVNSEISRLLGKPCLYYLKDSYPNPPICELWIYRPDGKKELLGDNSHAF